jgi:ribulose-phosphate 3-epimerase
MIKISPSILAGDFLHLEDEIKKLEKSKVDYVHYDIMDGHFVPNITYGFKFMKSLHEATELPGDAHLMITNAEKYLDELINTGIEYLTFHYEAVQFPIRFINEIKKNNRKAGISINPGTPVHVLEEVIEMADLILLMSVEPGFYGQSFIEGTYAKISELKDLIERKKSKAIIEVDGGVGLANYKKLIDAGADMFVIGSDYFKQKDLIEYVNTIKSYQK